MVRINIDVLVVIGSLVAIIVNAVVIANKYGLFMGTVYGNTALMIWLIMTITLNKASNENEN